MSGSYVRRYLQGSSGGRANCSAGGVWDSWKDEGDSSGAGGRYSCFKPCPSDFPYPVQERCYQYPADYKPPAPSTPPPASSTAPPVNQYTPPNPANSNTSSGSHGADTGNSHNNSSVSPPDNHQQAYNNSAGYNDVFSSDPGLTNAPADVGAGANSGSPSGGMDTNTIILIGGLAVAGILAVKMMKK